MASRLTRAMLLACVFSGFCLSAQANTTGAPPQPGTPFLSAQNDLALPLQIAPVAVQPMVKIALLLPLRSDTLHTPAEVVLAGFQAGFEREPDGVEVQLVETGDAPQDVLTGFNAASVEHDIVVGPLSRSGVTAVAQGGMRARPTIALTVPDIAADAPLEVPPQMLVMGLSVEDDARQAAEWAAAQHPSGKALVLFTGVAWQRRAARAFEQHWQQLGRELESMELASSDGVINGRMLLQMKTQMQPEQPLLIFAALDARQTRQVRSLMGSELPLYGTSQLNPLPVSQPAEPIADMDGVRLLDIPWQLQPDHAAVMAYPPLQLPAGVLRTADMERLYALGIDAYRVAHQIAQQHRRFELDGVTGRLAVGIDDAGAHFTRTLQPAIYRNGTVVPLTPDR
jgi:outer membrane PBP1 activator LpoA protein